MTRWIVDHDRSWLFVILYVGLAVVLSVWVSLFWLLFMAGVHFALEWIRHAILRGEAGIVVPLNALWEVKLDLALVLVALALALYMELILGVLGLQSAARAGAAVRAGGKVGTRVAGWERLIRGFFLTVDDLANVARAFVMRRGGEAVPAVAEAVAESGAPGEGASDPVAPSAPAAEAPLEGPPPTVEPPPYESGGIGPRPPLLWTARWDRGDVFSLGLALVSVVLIVATPLFTSHSPGSALAVLATELHPFPGRE